MITCRNSYASAIARARQYAKEGPRVASVLCTVKPKRLKYCAAPGFLDEDLDSLKQILLVTPDGRTWKQTEEKL